MRDQRSNGAHHFRVMHYAKFLMHYYTAGDLRAHRPIESAVPRARQYASRNDRSSLITFINKLYAVINTGKTDNYMQLSDFAIYPWRAAVVINEIFTSSSIRALMATAYKKNPHLVFRLLRFRSPPNLNALLRHNA